MPLKTTIDRLKREGRIVMYEPRLRHDQQIERYIYLTIECQNELFCLPDRAPNEDPFVSSPEQIKTLLDSFCAGEELIEWSADLNAGDYKKRNGHWLLATRSVRCATLVLSKNLLLCTSVRLKGGFKDSGQTETQWFNKEFKKLHDLGFKDD